MNPAITSLPSGLRVGHAWLARRGAQGAAGGQRSPDGGSATVEAAGSLCLRLLGVDVPELAFPLPGGSALRAVGSAEWAAFLDDPFADASLEFLNALGHPLRKHLVNGRFGPGCAANHARHAEAAQCGLEALIREDMRELGQDVESFRFFLAFAHEVMDGFGRLLCFAQPSQPEEPRPRSYNERLIELGLAHPRFVWPNVNPFRAARSLEAAVPAAGDLSEVLADASLRAARDDAHAARVARIGVFKAAEPLRLEPFELRYLARGEPPSRWLVNLADPGTDVLLRPTSYPDVPNAEDRLFVPSEYVPLWVELGWRREA